MRVGEIFGCLPVSPVGSLRQPDTLPNTDLCGLKKHIKDAANRGIQFNYTLNSPWLGGLEGRREGRRALLAHIESLAACGVRRFTVSLPFLAQLVRAHLPDCRVSVSIVAGADTGNALKQWKEFGADRVVLSRDSNRDFRLLRETARTSGLELEVLATSPCILNCQETSYHGLVSAHLSQKKGDARQAGQAGVYDQFYNCRLYAVSSPEEFIKMPWIRPEDTGLYEEAGVAWIKIDGRDKSSSYNIKRASRYSEGRHEGNLLHLLLESYPETRKAFSGPPVRGSAAVYIDNRRLDGFVKATWYTPDFCRNACRDCRVCASAAERFVELDGRWKTLVTDKQQSDMDEYLLKKEDRRR